MSFCLPKEFSTKFKESLKNGEIIPEKLAEMTSAERRAFLAKIVGEADARDVNALFESKLLLKDQKRGMVTWAKKVAGITEQTRKDLLAKIEKLEKVLDADSKQAFLEDLAAQKLGTEVSFEQAGTIMRLSKEADELLSKIPEDAPDGGVAELAYGLKYVEFQNYVRSLKGEDFNVLRDAKDVKGVGDAVAYGGKLTVETFGVFKSLLSAFDNSFFGRQGLPVLLTNPDVWAKNFVKSFGDIKKEIFRRKVDIDPMDLIKARIYGMKEARNGEFEALGLDVGLLAEEAFPSSLPGKVPGLGRAYAASETAFQGAALRMRADIGRKYIQRAKQFGVDTKSKTEMRPIGRVINSMTGRGGLPGMSEGLARGVNAMFFSPRFLTGNWNTLTGHSFGAGLRGRNIGSKLARRVAAENMLKITGSITALLILADTLNPGSVEWDSRSSKFGKIKLGNTYFDVTGGKGPVATLLSRVTPNWHDGKLSWWTKSATTGKWTDLTAGKFGQLDGTDVFANFFEGKLAPGPAIYRDLLTGKNFQGEKPTAGSILYGSTVPLPIQSALQRRDVEDFSTPEGVAGIILEGLGLSASTYERKK